MRSEWASRREQSAAPTEAVEPAAPQEPSEPVVEPKVDAQGNLHGPDGKFAGKAAGSPGESRASDQPAGAEAPAVETPLGSEGPTETPAAEGSPEGIRIDIPADHPLRGMGVETLHANDAQQERAIRALLNSHTRRAEVEQAQQALRQYEDAIAERDARLEVAQNRVRQLIADPSLASIYGDLKQAYGEEHANRWLDGELRQDDSAVQERLQAYQQQRLQSDAVQAAQSFQQQAFEAAQGYYPQFWTQSPDFQQAFSRAYDLYDTMVGRAIQQGQTVVPSVEQFVGDVLQREYLASPVVRAEAQRQLQEEQAKAAAEAEAAKKAEAERLEREKQATAAAAVQQFKQQAAQTRQQMPPHPMGQLGGAARADLQSTGPQQEDTSNMSPYQLKQRLRQEVRQMGRAFSRP